MASPEDKTVKSDSDEGKFHTMYVASYHGYKTLAC